MSFTTHIKRLIYPLYILPKITSRNKKKIQDLYVRFSNKNQPTLIDTNFNLRLFSSLEEDGIILQIIAALNIKQGYFLDIGSNDCINSNCANLVFNLNWSGVFIDANQHLLNIGKRNYNFFKKNKDLKFVNSMLYPHNINQIIKANATTLDIDFMNIDIDGNDYAIWEAIEIVNPKVVLIENKIEYGKFDIVVPVSEQFLPNQWGASIVSVTNLANQKGYTLIATNKQGFNAFYVRNDLFIKHNFKELLLAQVFASAQINSCFYGNTIMQHLLAQIKLIKKPQTF